MMRVFRRYLLFQLPDAAAGGFVVLLLVHNEVVSSAVGWLLFALWLAKELALFPLVRRAYEPMSPHGTEALVGERGFVTAMPVNEGETGFVRIGPELWRASAAEGEALPPIGTPVCVKSVEGFTLRVSPEGTGEEGSPSAAEEVPGIS